MCSAAVLLCVCVCRISVRVRTCHTTSPSSSAPAVQISSITCVCRCVHGTAYTLRTQHGLSSVCMYSGVHTALAVCVAHACMCSAAVLLCVCVCRIRLRVRTCHTTSPSSSVPAVQIPSTTCVCIISHVCMRLQLRTAARPETSFRVFRHVTSYTCVQRNPCAHCHHTMRPSSPDSAVPFTGDQVRASYR